MTTGDLLVHGQFWILEAQFAALVVLGARELPGIVRCAGWTRRQAASVLLCAALSGALAALIAPRTNRIYYDEQIYQEIGQNMSDLRLAQVCNDGSVEYGRLQCSSAEYNKEPYGYPYLLGLAYRLFGVHGWIAFAFNNLVCALIAAGVGLLAGLLFEDWWSALGATLLVPLAPAQLQWTNTAAAEPSAELFTLLAVIGAVYFCRTRGRGALLLMAVSTAFAMNLRPESLLVVPLVGLIVLLFARDEPWRRLGGAGALAALLSVLLVLHFARVRNESWGASGARLSLAYLRSNLRANGLFYLWDSRFPVAVTAAAAFGALWSRRWRAVALLLAYFGVFWAMFLVFYAGSYDYGADVRYSLLTYPPLFVLGGVGWAAVRRAIARRAAGARATAVALLALVPIFSWYAPLARSIGEESWSARADVAFAEKVAATLPPESFVLAQTPSMFLVWGIDAGQMAFATDRQYVMTRLAGRYPGGVYLHWGFWCNVVDPVQQDICNKVRSEFPHVALAETDVRSSHFAFYRLDLSPPVPAAAPPPPPSKPPAGRP